MATQVRLASVALLSCLALAWATPGTAQEASSSAQPSINSSGIEGIIVTARRREETIERVPTAITALSADQLTQRNITSDADLQLSVAGLTVRQTQGTNSLTFSIRGQTVDVFTGSQSAVTPYLNEVQLVKGGASTFFDLDSIQVLKGPQGTLFGRNATGGAILYTAKRPGDEFGGYAKIRAGNYNLHEGEGAVDIPVNDTLSMRLAADVIKQDGYQHNLYNGQWLGETDRKSGRLSVLWKPASGLENLLLAQYDEVGGNSTATRLRTVNRLGTSNGGFPLNTTADFLFSPLVDSAFGAGTWAAYIAAHPQVNPNGIAAYLDQNAKKLGFLQANEVSDLFHDEKDYYVINTTSYDLSDTLKIKNIFGYSKSDTTDLGSTIGAPYLIFVSSNATARGNQVNAKGYSDELQLQGTALDGALSYTTGLYYLWSETDNFLPQTFFDLSPLAPGTFATNDFGVKDKSTAAYAQATYNLTSALSLTTGLRYTWETLQMTQLSRSLFQVGLKEEIKNDDPSWTLGLAYQVNDNLMLYAQHRRSWRTGGFNGTSPPVEVPASGGGNLFNPETVKDIEVGAKFAGHLMDMPVRANLAVYQQWVEDLQRTVNVVPPGRQQAVSVTANVEKAEVKGVEFDGSVGLTNWLDTGVSFAYTDAKYTKNVVVIFGQTTVFGPYSDTPKLTGSVYARLGLPAPAEWGEMSLRADWYAQSEMFYSANNSTITPGTRIGGYQLLNMRYDWKKIFGSKASVAAFAKNLNNKEYFVGGFPLTASVGTNSESIGVPRMYGIELSYDF